MTLAVMNETIRINFHVGSDQYPVRFIAESPLRWVVRSSQRYVARGGEVKMNDEAARSKMWSTWFSDVRLRMP